MMTSFDPSTSGPFSEPKADYLFAVGYGQRSGHRRMAALGHNPDIDAGPEDVWTGGGNYPWMTSETSLEVVCADAADTAAGTGARTVRVDGLDANYDEVSQTVTLNGVTPVALSSQLFRINSAIIMTAGSGKVNAGDITVRDAGAGTTRAIVPAGYGITRQSIFTCPRNHTLQIHAMFFGINRPASQRDVTVATFIQTSAGVYRMPLEISLSGTSPYLHEGLPGLIVSERSDFCLRCTYVSLTNTDLTAGVLGVLKDNRVR